MPTAALSTMAEELHCHANRGRFSTTVRHRRARLRTSLTREMKAVQKELVRSPDLACIQIG
jgi:hypothetical protein